MRLGFHYHVPAVSRPDGIYMPGYLGRFVDSLAHECESVLCFLHSPRPDEFDHMDYRLGCRNVKLVDIGPHASTMERTLRARRYTGHLRRHAAELDALLARGPSPLLPAMASASPVPVALLLVGDYLAGVNDLPQPRWRKEAIRLWSAWNKWGQDRAARRCLTFVNSRVLFDELKGKAAELHEIRTTTLTEDDFFLREDTCQAPPYRLLYVGRISRSKGLLQMVEAVALLTERGEQVTLDLVGWPEPGDPILAEIESLSRERKLDGRVRYLGSKALGPELFECYRQADIFLIASLSNFEGFPRVIWEAMAHSLPVIATRVASIPAFIEGAAELVEPGSAELLASAIARFLHVPELRKKCIEKGLEIVRDNTLEKQAIEMIGKMRTRFNLPSRKIN